MKLSKRLRTLALASTLTLPAAVQASQLWQIQIDYTDRIDWYAPHEADIDHLLFFTQLFTLTTWQALGYIVAFGENTCGPCFVGTTYLYVSPHSPDPLPTSPPSAGEPATFMMLGTALIGAAMGINRFRKVAV